MVEFDKTAQSLSISQSNTIDLTHAVRLRFGSPDSNDQDVLYVVNKLPDLQTGKRLCQSTNENRNLVRIESGVIVDCFKGLPDETNNALLATYNFHNQEYQCPIEKRVERIVPLKVVRATRIVLSLLSRTEYRSEIIEALHSENFAKRIDVLSKINFKKLELEPNVIKSIAFQLGQTVALINKTELYTKDEVKTYLPTLKQHIERKANADLSALNDIRDLLVSKLQGVYIRLKGSLNLFMYENGPAINDWNQYARQSRGMVIDLKQERCVMFPMDKFFRFGEGPEDSREALYLESSVEIVEKVDRSMVTLVSLLAL